VLLEIAAAGNQLGINGEGYQQILVQEDNALTEAEFVEAAVGGSRIGDQDIPATVLAQDVPAAVLVQDADACLIRYKQITRKAASIKSKSHPDSYPDSKQGDNELKQKKVALNDLVNIQVSSCNGICYQRRTVQFGYTGYDMVGYNTGQWDTIIGVCLYTPNTVYHYAGQLVTPAMKQGCSREHPLC